MIKILYITHLSGKRVNRFWISSIFAAHKLGYEFHLACNMQEAEQPAWDEDCRKYKIITHQIDFNRNPIHFQNWHAAKQLRELLREQDFATVHCNTPVGGLIGRICANKEGISTIIYQAHGFHFWKGAPLHNWLFYYPIEKWLAHKTDVLITINQEDYLRAKSFAAKNVIYIPGVGIDTNMFSKRKEKKEQIRKNLGIPSDAIVLLSVGELSKRKNHRIAIEAIKDLDNVLYLICGQGAFLSEYQNLAERLGIKDKVIFLGYIEAINDFYNVADIFILPSYQEGLSVALMEAMASELPCVVSDIRGNVDLVEDKAYRFSPDNKVQLVKILKRVLASKEEMINEGIFNRKTIVPYSLETITDEMCKIYDASRTFFKYPD